MFVRSCVEWVRAANLRVKNYTINELPNQSIMNNEHFLTAALPCWGHSTLSLSLTFLFLCQSPMKMSTREMDMKRANPIWFRHFFRSISFFCCFFCWIQFKTYSRNVSFGVIVTNIRNKQEGTCDYKIHNLLLSLWILFFSRFLFRCWFVFFFWQSFNLCWQ